MPPETRRPFSLSPQGRRAVRAVAILAALVGALLGVETLVLHLTTDPLVDIHRYYEAGARLNAGLPLYGQVSEDTTATYLYPPLLAILFRPLALLPFPVAAAAWEGVVVGALLVTIRRIGVDRRLLLVLGWLALPLCWALVIGQVEPVVVLLLTIGSPATVALAGHVKLLPWLAAAYWLARGDRRALVRFVAWVAGLGVLQLVLEPAGTIAFVRLEWLQGSLDVRNVSLWAVHPVLWVIGVVVSLALALRLARTRWGWACAVVLTVAANPRLLVYQLLSLVAALGGPRDDRDPAA